MGGAVSSGRNNDDLIDNLLEADYIKSALIERVFRAVDRAEYFLPEARNQAYKDLAWKSGHLHISAPCIYSEVMEGLCIEPSLSFLNLGSGTGYLSTMVGLILGSNGVNHGVEIYEDVIEYANKKVEEFKKHSGAMDEFDFCEPKFVKGNCLTFTSECTNMYDRIYCGAACPEEFEIYMKKLLKIDGILVMPINEQLLQIQKITETTWRSKSLLPVSFASLIEPSTDDRELLGPIDTEIPSLQAICRAVVRNILRKNIEIEHPPVKRQPPAKAPKKKRALRRLVIPLFDSDESSEDEPRVRVRLGGERNRDAGRATLRWGNNDNNFLNFFMGIGGGSRAGSSERDNNNQNSQPSNQSNQNNQAGNQERQNNREEAMETDSSLDEPPERNKARRHKVKAVVEPVPENEDNRRGPSLDVAFNEISTVIEDCLSVLRRERIPEENMEHNDDPEVSDNNPANQSVNGNGKLNSSSTIGMEGVPAPQNGGHDTILASRSPSHGTSKLGVSEGMENCETEKRNQDEEGTMECIQPSTSRDIKKPIKKREKFDSGLGDEIVTQNDSSDDEHNYGNQKLDAISSCDDESNESSESRKNKRGMDHKNPARKIRRFTSALSDMSSSEQEQESTAQLNEDEMRMYKSPYTEHMSAKIQTLPLPTILKRYLNYYREF